MHHDRRLLEQLGAFVPVSFEGEVFRATPLTLNPLAPSVIGGRWMVPNDTPTLYTSTESDGALAEIAFHWSQLSPMPSKPAALHRIRLTTKKSLRLTRADLINLGVDWPRYATLNYQRTRAIGAAIAHLQCDGLIAPSARWSCDNVMVFFTNLTGAEDSAILLDSTEVDWLAWAKARGRVEGFV